jgi:anaerobic magnesium-protoporphyrin IX monomethyl ester cyclase
MNILLVNVKNPYVDSNNPPLGLGYISAYLKAHTKDEIRVVDLTVDQLSFKEFSKRYLHDFRPELIGISTVTPTYIYAVDLATKIKKEIDVHIAVGGPHPSALPEETAMEPCFDSVVVGEGEIAFLKLRNTLSAKKQVKKIIFGERIKDINSLPFPDRSIFPIDKYNFTIDGVKATSIIASRGCPFHCVYCDKSIFGSKVSQRSPENIIAEIEHLMCDFDIKGFNFLDDIFTLNKKIVNRFCELVTKKKS